MERRVDVRGGGAPRGPVERPTRVARPPRRQERTLARDSLLLIGLVVIGLVAVRLVLPESPLSAVASESPVASQAAVVTFSPQTFGPTRTPFIETLTPVVTPSSEPSVTEAPTPVPVPTPTLKPGQTPKPTPKPTPRVTPAPTAPKTANVIVKMHVINNSGGLAVASSWTMLIQGEAGSAANPNSFPGSESGRTVTIPAGKGYKVTDAGGVAGYAARVSSPDCIRADGSGGLAAGTTVTCTITRSDRPRVLVKTLVINDDAGTASASDWSVTVNGELAIPSSFTGSESGTIVVVGADLTYTVTMSGPFDGDYTLTTDGDCGPLALSADAPATTCTFTYDDNPAAPGPVVPWLLPAWGFLGYRRPRWWTALRTR